jgi:hypothetical protein
MDDRHWHEAEALMADSRSKGHGPYPRAVASRVKGGLRAMAEIGRRRKRTVKNPSGIRAASPCGGPSPRRSPGARRKGSPHERA